MDDQNATVVPRKKPHNPGRLVSWSKENMSGVWMFNDFRFDETITGEVTVLFGWQMLGKGLSVRFYSPNTIQLHCRGLLSAAGWGNEGSLIDPPKGFIEQLTPVIQATLGDIDDRRPGDANADLIFEFIIAHSHLSEDEMIAASIVKQKLWHAEQTLNSIATLFIDLANSHLKNGMKNDPELSAIIQRIVQTITSELQITPRNHSDPSNSN